MIFRMSCRNFRLTFEHVILAVVFLFVGIPYVSEAKVRYINDINYVPLRVGPGDEYRIIHKGLETGMEVELLEEDPENSYSRIRVNNREGYIPTRYLSGDKPARVKIVLLKEQYSEVNKKLNLLKKEVSEKELRIASLSEKLSEMDKVIGNKTLELVELRRVSSDPISVKKNNEELRTENELLTGVMQKLEKTNDQLKKDYYFTWFIYGVGTIVLGIFLGIILMKLNLSRKSNSWD